MSACGHFDIGEWTFDDPLTSDTTESTNSAETASQLTTSALPAESYERSDILDEISSPTAQMGELLVHFIDVGQGDSIFIELPNSETMLIDAGNTEAGDKVVDYIFSQGYDTVDYVIATHPHNDHIGGMTAVFNNFNVSDVYLTPYEYSSSAYDKTLAAIESSGARTHCVSAGDTILEDSDLLIEVVAPKTLECEDMNDISVVVKLSYKERRFLFTGDAEKEEEDGIWTNIKCDVLKVGHHGSGSSTSANFLKKVEPIYAVISVGYENAYGHPSEKLLKRLAERNISIYRTDVQGTIVFMTDGTEISVNKEPFLYELPAVSDIQPPETGYYVLNTKTKRIHYPFCKSVKDIKDTNKAFTEDYDEAITQGYKPCGECKP